MGSKKTQSLILFAAGLLVLVVSLAADALGIGAVTGIGYKQILGGAAGIAMTVAGYIMK